MIHLGQFRLGSSHFGNRRASWEDAVTGIAGMGVAAGTAVPTTTRTVSLAKETFDMSALPEDALEEINRIGLDRGSTRW